jgi:hypothetical protein
MGSFQSHCNCVAWMRTCFDSMPKPNWLEPPRHLLILFLATALAVYQELSALGNMLVNGLPADLVACRVAVASIPSRSHARGSCHFPVLFSSGVTRRTEPRASPLPFSRDLPVDPPFSRVPWAGTSFHPCRRTAGGAARARLSSLSKHRRMRSHRRRCEAREDPF